MRKIIILMLTTLIITPNLALARGSSGVSGGGRSSGASTSRSSGGTSTKSYSNSSTKTSSYGKSVPTKSYSYSGRSVNYGESYSLFSPTNLVLWYFLLSQSTRDVDSGDGSVRDIYEDQLSAIKDRMKKHEKLPTYEQTVEQMVKVFGGLNISPQEIGATYYVTYSKVGPAPERQL